MVYTVRAQSFDDPHIYCAYECADFDTWMSCIVSVAQTRRRGARMRLMDCTEDGVRFDVQYTKQ